MDEDILEIEAEKPEQTNNGVRPEDGIQDVSQDPNDRYEDDSTIDEDGNEVA